MDKNEFNKLKKGLECCQYCHINMCEYCPYYGEGGDDDDPDYNECQEVLIKDALRLVNMLDEHENARYMLLGF